MSGWITLTAAAVRGLTYAITYVITYIFRERLISLSCHAASFCWYHGSGEGAHGAQARTSRVVYTWSDGSQCDCEHLGPERWAVRTQSLGMGRGDHSPRVHATGSGVGAGATATQFACEGGGPPDSDRGPKRVQVPYLPETMG